MQTTFRGNTAFSGICRHPNAISRYIYVKMLHLFILKVSLCFYSCAVDEIDQFK